MSTKSCVCGSCGLSYKKSDLTISESGSICAHCTYEILGSSYSICTIYKEDIVIEYEYS